MSKKIVYYSFILLLFCFKVNAQSKEDTLSITFKLKFNKEALAFNKQYITSNKDTLTFDNFKCYISHIQIHYDDNSVFTQTNSYHLLDIENPSSFQIPITKVNDKIISKVTFNIGVDSLATTAGALTGDLDPIKGMYWAWQSGYINMKIEGKSSSCQTRKNEFHFHIGGYLPPYYALRYMELIYDKKATQINIGIDLYNFLANLNLAKINRVMIPGNIAMELADYSKTLFYIE